MIKTKICKSPQRGQFIIYVDEEPWKIFFSAVFGRNISIPQEFSNIEELSQYFFELEKKHTLNYVLKLLSNADLPSAQITKKLRHKNISESSILYSLKKIKEYNYIDDNNWVKKYILHSLSKGQGPLLIKAKLMQKQISSDMIENALSEINKKDLQRSLEKAISKKSHCDKNKLIASLMRNGFSYETISEFIL